MTDGLHKYKRISNEIKFLGIYFYYLYFFYLTNVPTKRPVPVPVVAKVLPRSGSNVYLITEISSFSSRITAVHASERSTVTAEDQHFDFLLLPGVNGPVCSAVASLSAPQQAVFSVGLLV